MILPDHAITGISPLEPALKREGKISYGLSSYGYDARIGYRFKVFSPVHSALIDPKAFDDKAFVEVNLTPRVERCNWCPEPSHPNAYFHPNRQVRHAPDGSADAMTEPYIIMPPHSFILGETIETFDIPRDCLAIVLGKSTYARCGLIVNVTPLEPEWRGKVTVEISNTTPLPAKVYAGEGIMQIVFLRGESPCTMSYADKRGKYQDQTGIVLPIVD